MSTTALVIDYGPSSAYSMKNLLVQGFAVFFVRPLPQRKFRNIFFLFNGIVGFRFVFGLVIFFWTSGGQMMDEPERDTYMTNRFRDQLVNPV